MYEAACENDGVKKKVPKKEAAAKKRTPAAKRPAPVLPRGKQARRRVEYFGAATITAFALLIVLAFSGSVLHRMALRSPQVAAVVTAVLVDLANDDRAQAGLPPLSVSPTLTAVAQAKANDMAAKGYFAHTSPQGLDPWHWFTQEGYAFEYAGENLAIDFSDSADVNRAWMNSPTHRENLLDPDYTEIGIATAQGMYQGKMTVFVVQAFGTPGTEAGAQAVAASSVPEEPTEIATAAAGAAVLGTAVLPREVAAAGSAPQPDDTSQTLVEPHRPTMPTITVATTDPALAGALAEDASRAKPLWRVLVAFPRSTLQYAYYLIGLMVLVALLFETGLELRWHHRQHAARAGVLIASMFVLFFAADVFFFTQPVLAAVAAAL